MSISDTKDREREQELSESGFSHFCPPNSWVSDAEELRLAADLSLDALSNFPMLFASLRSCVLVDTAPTFHEEFGEVLSCVNPTTVTDLTLVTEWEYHPAVAISGVLEFYETLERLTLRGVGLFSADLWEGEELQALQSLTYIELGPGTNPSFAELRSLLTNPDYKPPNFKTLRLNHLTYRRGTTYEYSIDEYGPHSKAAYRSPSYDSDGNMIPHDDWIVPDWGALAQEEAPELLRIAKSVGVDLGWNFREAIRVQVAFEEEKSWVED